jgi:alpha-tubulin suppressor-like RCC1 family protein
MRAWWFFVLVSCGGPSTVAPTVTPTAVQTQAPGPVVPVQIACGDFHSCALMSNKTVRCWGRNKGGELGDGTDADKNKPTAVAVKDVEQIAAGANVVCVRHTDGSVGCWGTSRVLDGQFRERMPHTVVSSLSGATDLVAGGYMVCAQRAAGVACVGLDKTLPGAPTASVKALAAAGAHACAVVDDGVRCWGESSWAKTFAAPKLTGARGLSTTDSAACALLEDGAVRCWGRNDEGELGTAPDSDDHATPVAPGVLRAVALSSAEAHTCALLGDKSVVCWGSNTEGELGRGTKTTSEKPARIPGLSAKQVAMGAAHGCALTTGGDVVCWGNNRNGQLGDGSTESRDGPVRVSF